MDQVALPNQLGTINELVQAGNSSVNDLREFMRDWTSLEKDYGLKLESMVKKYQKLKDKKLTSMSVGSAANKEGNGSAAAGPLVDFNAESDSSSYVKAWNQLLQITGMISQEHLVLAENIQNELAEPARLLGQKKEEARKKHMAYCQQLLELRDQVYSEKDKRQSKYTDIASQTQALQSKYERSVADKSHDKARRQYEKLLIEKNNLQNLYIASVDTSNAMKKTYFHKDIPCLMNQLQELNHSRILSARTIWTRWIELQNESIQKLHGHMAELNTAVRLIDPVGDSTHFITRNPESWTEPLDFQFVPVVHSSDRGEYVVNEDTRTFLANWQSRELDEASEFQSSLEQLRVPFGEVEKSMLAADPKDPVGPWHDLFDKYLDMSHDLMTLDWKQQMHQTEADSMAQATGTMGLGDEAEDAHKFRPHTFAIPTSCDYCHGKLWSVMGKNDQSCAVCGYNVHKKCLFKVPIDCPGSVAALRRRRSLIRSVAVGKTASSNSSSSSVVQVGLGIGTPGLLNNGNGLPTRRFASSSLDPQTDESLWNDSPAGQSTTAAIPSLIPANQKSIAQPTPPPPYHPSSAGEKPLSRRKPPPPPPSSSASSMTTPAINGNAFAAAASAAAGEAQRRSRSGSSQWKGDIVPTDAIPTIPLPPLAGGGGVTQPPSTTPARVTTTTTTRTITTQPGRSRKARALYDYTPTSPGGRDMAFQKGAIFTLVSADPQNPLDDGTGWAEVEFNGKRGIVPSNYIELMPAVAPINTALPARMNMHTPAISPHKVKALYDFEARDAKELSLKANDEITVTNAFVSDGWMEVICSES
ncbi:Protein BZZ1 [Dimargaris cristalligena]|nr:Protein BZZ1 [Dimargaris cristalligena]